MKKKDGPPRVRTVTADGADAAGAGRERALRPVTRAAWPFGVAGFAAGATALGAVAAFDSPSVAPCSADAPQGLGERVVDGWAHLLRHVDPTPRRSAGAPPPMHVDEPSAPRFIPVTAPSVDPRGDMVTAGVARPVRVADPESDADAPASAAPTSTAAPRREPRRRR
ncbi:MAG TPA: hypothetical protein VGM56_32580 [Byssovorax sp.]|jgi:hypothetical protein